MSDAPVRATRQARVAEAVLLVGCALCLSVAVAAVPAAALRLVGREELRNQLLLGAPGFVLLAAWWLTHVSHDPDPSFLPHRHALLTTGAVLPVAAMVALAYGVSAISRGALDVHGLVGSGDLVATGITLLAVALGCAALTRTRRT